MRPTLAILMSLASTTSGNGRVMGTKTCLPRALNDRCNPAPGLKLSIALPSLAQVMQSGALPPPPVIQFEDHLGLLWRGRGSIYWSGTDGHWRRFGVVGRTDTVLRQKEDDVRHCQQSPFWSLPLCANTAHSWHCKPFPYLWSSLTHNANGTVLSCSIVDM